MSEFVFVRAWPRDPATGAETQIRLAGGGDGNGYRTGGAVYRAGIVSPPRFSASADFDESGWTGRVLPKVTPIQFAPADKALRDQILSLVWNKARVEVDCGASTTTLSRRLTGTISSIRWSDGLFTFTAADLSTSFDRRMLSAAFAGTGGLEGYDGAAGRVKRRSFGIVRNVEAFVLLPQYNIYECGDPAHALNAIVAARDIGREGPLSLVQWAGTAAQTLTNLIAAAPMPGGAVVAPSIACLKWWTAPVGPLTVDIQGEVGPGFVKTAPAIASRLVELAGGAPISNLAAAAGWRSADAGIHITDASESWATAIDRLTLGASLLWVLDGDGTSNLRQWSFESPAARLKALYIERENILPPTRSRTLRYKINHRVHSEAELSSGLNGGTNIIANSHFRDGLAQWSLYYRGETPGNDGATLSLAASGALRIYNPAGGMFTLAGVGPYDGGGAHTGGHHLIRVHAGQRIFWRMRGRVEGRVDWAAPYLRYLNMAASTEVSGQWGFVNNGQTMSATNPDAWGWWDVPATAGIHWAECEIYPSTDDPQPAPGPAGFEMDAFLLAFADPAQTTPPPWSEGPTARYRADVTGENVSAAVAGQGPGATAAGSAVLNSYIGPGQNLIPNSDQTLGRMFALRGNPDGIFTDNVQHPTLVTPGLYSWTTANYVLAGDVRSVVVHQTGRVNPLPTGYGYIDYDVIGPGGDGTRFAAPCAPGEMFIASIYAATHRCLARLYIHFFNAAGALIQQANVAMTAATDALTNSLEDGKFKRLYVKATAPAGAVSLGVIVGKCNTLPGQTDSWAWFAAPMLERAAPDQITASPYMPGPPNTVRQIGYTGHLNADVTADNVAAAVAGQSEWTTYTGLTPGNVAGRVQHLDTGGNLAGLTRITDRRLTLLRRADGATAVTEPDVITAQGVSLGYQGQTIWGTYTGYTPDQIVKPAANLLYDAALALGGQQWGLNGWSWNSGADIGYFVNANGSNVNMQVGGRVRVIAGYPHTFSLYSGGQGYSDGGVMQLNYYDSADVFIGQATVAGTFQNQGYQRTSVTLTAPANAVYARCFMQSPSFLTGFFIVHKPKLEIGSTATPWTNEATYGARYQQGETIDALKPAQAGADVTEDNISLGYQGQTDWGTYTGISTGNMANRVSRLSGTSGRITDPTIYNSQLLLGPSNTTNLNPSYTVGASNVTVNLPAHTRKIAGASGPITLSYGAMSGVVDFDTYWTAYVDDPNLTGFTSPTATFTSNPDDLLYPGRYQVASGMTPNSSGAGGGVGSGGGGGGDFEDCVDASSHMPDGRRAGDYKPGDMILALNDNNPDATAMTKVIGNRIAVAECIELTSATGVRVVVSVTTPCTLRSGECVMASAALGHELAVLDAQGFRWERIVQARIVGPRNVAHISCNDGTYAAGAQPGRFIFTHNINFKP